MVEIKTGDCIEQLMTLADCSVHCCVTSPPYFGLRDYGHAGQIGLEKTPEAYVAKMVEVFREVRRVLRDDGTLWLNLGDSYGGSGKGRNADGSHGVNGGDKQRTSIGTIQGTLSQTSGSPKQLLGIPWRVAFALQADGWILRQDIIWHKPNPMPESVRDRCTKAHEYLFLFAKSKRYWFDGEAMKENPDKVYVRKATPNHKLQERTVAGSALCASTSDKNGFGRDIITTGRNRRSVWSICPRPYKGAHFAVFPPALVEPCVKAGCPEGGTVLDPFGGSGTTGQVARQHGRNCILIELNTEYVKLIHKRLKDDKHHMPLLEE